MEVCQTDPRIHFLYMPQSLNPSNIEEIHASLEIIENYKGPCALILTSKNPKIFCAGMDLKFIRKNGILTGKHIAESLLKILARLLNLPCPIIAAINGHAIAGGLLLALSADYVIMTSESGSLAMTEILIGLVIPSGANMLLKAKLHPAVHRDLALKGVYFNSAQAKEAGIVDLLVPKSDLITRAVYEAQEMLVDGGVHQVIKAQRTTIYAQVISRCEKGVYDPEFYNVMKFSKL